MPSNDASVDAWLDYAPWPMILVEGSGHAVRFANLAFRKMLGDLHDDVVGKPLAELLPTEVECLSLLDHVRKTGTFASCDGHQPGPSPAPCSFAIWPVVASGVVTGATLQITPAIPFQAITRAMNEELMLGALRQHELAAAANSSNVQLRTEIVERKQRELDSLLLTNEISHRIKNNLQVIISLISLEARQADASCVPGYLAIQARIGAIAKLYDLISTSGLGRMVPVDAYLREIARIMSVSLLAGRAGIVIEAVSDPLSIDASRAVPLGLLINELGTNAVKHAFPGGRGTITLKLLRVAGGMELSVSDDGVGIKGEVATAPPGKHGADYVAIFVRQLGGTMTVSKGEQSGTIIKVGMPVAEEPATRSVEESSL